MAASARQPGTACKLPPLNSHHFLSPVAPADWHEGNKTTVMHGHFKRSVHLLPVIKSSLVETRQVGNLEGSPLSTRPQGSHRDIRRQTKQVWSFCNSTATITMNLWFLFIGVLIKPQAHNALISFLLKYSPLTSLNFGDFKTETLI